MGPFGVILPTKFTKLYGLVFFDPCEGSNMPPIKKGNTIANKLRRDLVAHGPPTIS